jgi:signal transduction histidine kinase
MIEKLLDVARVDSGQSLIKTAPYNIHLLLSQYLAENREYIEKKGFNIQFKSTDQAAKALIDKDSFGTIVSNLTENAVKYSTDDKFIEYQITSNKDYVFFSISDHGIGIPKKAQKNVFNKFFRVEESDSLSSKIKGHGLGLSIVKNMVELNHGSIEIKSSFGKGTTFIVRFPKLKEDELNKNRPQATVDDSSAQQT